MPFIVPQGAKGTASEWIGTGPFQATELKAGFWRLTRNPHYFLSPPYCKDVHKRNRVSRRNSVSFSLKPPVPPPSTAGGPVQADVTYGRAQIPRVR